MIKSNTIRIIQYPKTEYISGVMFKNKSIGLPIYDAVEPVTANTINMIIICQLCLMPHLAFSLSTLAILLQK